MDVTFTNNIQQTKIIQDNPYVNCGLVWEAIVTKPCPTGSIPYGTYQCPGYHHNQYNCTKPDESLCPKIHNVDLQRAYFSSSTFTNGSATLTCEYKYNPAKITTNSVEQCYRNFGNNNENCNTMESYLCTYTNSYLLSHICKDYCKNNYCNNIDSYCIEENLNNPTCQYYVLNNNQGYNFGKNAKEFCTGSNLETTICQQYCFGKDGVSKTDIIDCHKALKEYCKSISSTTGICKIFKKVEQYETAINISRKYITVPHEKEKVSSLVEKNKAKSVVNNESKPSNQNNKVSSSIVHKAGLSTGGIIGIIFGIILLIIIVIIVIYFLIKKKKAKEKKVKI